MKILIADDDVVNRKFLCKMLSEYEVKAVDNGMTAVYEAVQAIKDEDIFDLICLDIMMTKLDGYKVLEAIREAEKKYNIEKRSKVIMISALDELEHGSETASDDYDAYICKPIMIEQFNQLLKKLNLK